MNNPTNQTYKLLDEAFEYFNKELFGGKLPVCLITMQRKGKARGYFCPERFETRGSDGALIHEIALNPAHFKDRTDLDIISTLVHEMVHLWQQEEGDHPPRRNYHNREWGKYMEQIGLIPSNTGEPDGKKTGSAMSHYVAPGGRYETLAKQFLEKHEQLHYQDRPEIVIKRARKKNKIKYTCPSCGTNAWGKPGLKLVCGSDRADFLPEEQEEGEA